MKQFDHYTVEADAQLLDWLLTHLDGSHSKIKATLQGRGIQVNGKTITRYDYPLKAGMKIAVSKTKRNLTLKNHYVKIVYEDPYLVVVEKNVGILSMAAGHSTLNVKSVLDEYFEQTRQHCTAHVVHRLDRDTSGLMIYAKDKKTELKLEEDWHHTVYDRRYVAVLSGVMEQDQGTITSWLKENPAYVTYSSQREGVGKLAITHFYTLDRSREHSQIGRASCRERV